ncbi:hypothetical protein MKW98_021195 [Papaver atlanticum]|uniref:Cytochrome P450 n=1 Tax=Papaver atlanticum TaxID=357466 RepID=A0AAD4TA63_9MAGN|nr:hypothetical protein MKW98_021195 [Papaver atlanticum]
MWSVVLLLIALGTISFTHYAYRWMNPTCKYGKLPPGSMGFPLIGETIQFLIPSYSLDTPPFIKKKVSRFLMYGLLFKTSLAGKKMVITTDPEISNYVFMEEGKSVHLWYMDSFDNFLGAALINSTATAYIHKYLKNLFLNYVGNESLKDKLFHKIELMANEALNSWSTQLSVEVKECTAIMIIELVLKDLLSYDTTNTSTHNLVQMMSEFIKGIVNIPLNVPGTTFHRCMKNQRKVLELMKDILRERQNSTEERKGDFVDQLIDDVKKEEFMSEELAAVIMIATVFASFETISTAFRVAMMFLTDQQTPLVLEELLKEHQTIINNRENVDSPLTWQEYKSMTFTPQVRMNQLHRQNSTTNESFRYVIPNGWIIMVVQTAIHMNPNKLKDPLSFNPWRWNDTGSNIIGKSFIPFGGGKRNFAGTEFTKVLIWTKVKRGQAVRWPCLSVKDGFHVKISQKKTV